MLPEERRINSKQDLARFLKTELIQYGKYKKSCFRFWKKMSLLSIIYFFERQNII